MDYNHTALFVRVVKAGSFTAAAAEVGLPKSSVSRSVAHLERDLGVRLLQRTTRKLVLTEAGQAYYDTVSGSVAAIDEAEAVARERGAEPRGTVRVTAAPDFGGLASALAQFTRKYPGIRVELMITSRFVDLVTEGIDLAIRAGRLEDSSLVARRIGKTEMALMASPEYLRRRGKPKNPAELSSHDWVLYRASGGRTSLRLVGPERAETVEVTASLVADDLSFCRMAIEAGAGIALLPIHTALEALGTKRLEQVLPGWTYGDSSLFVVLPTSRLVPVRVALVRDFLIEQLGKQLLESQQRCNKANHERDASLRQLAAVRKA
jgi:DNA-binding transcriptional LysR family regulator